MAGDIEFRTQLRYYALILLGMAFIANTIDLLNGGDRTLSTNFNLIIALMYLLMIMGMVFDIIFSFLGKLLGYQPKSKKRRIKKRKSQSNDQEEEEEEDNSDTFLPFIDENGLNSITATIEKNEVLKHTEVNPSDPVTLIRNRFNLLFYSHIALSLLPYLILTVVYLNSKDIVVRTYFFGIITIMGLLTRHLITQYIHFSFTREHNYKLRGKSNVSNVLAIDDQRFVIAELICITTYLVVTGFYIELLFLVTIISLIQSWKQSSTLKIEKKSTAIYDEDNDVVLFLFNDVSECFYPYFDEEGEKILITTGMATYLHGRFEFNKYYEMEVESFSWYLPKSVRFLVNYVFPPISGVLIGILYVTLFSNHSEFGMFFVLISLSLFWIVNLIFGYYIIKGDIDKNKPIFQDIFEKETAVLKEKFPEIWTEYRSELYYKWKHLHSKSCIIYSNSYSSLYGYMTLTPNSYDVFNAIKPEGSTE